MIEISMKKLEYRRPKINLALLNTECCIANSSMRELQIDKENISVEIIDWQSADGFIDENVNVFD